MSLSIMAFTLVLLLQLLLVSLTSASHHIGGTTTYTYRGKTPDGRHIVDFHNRDTYDRCSSSHYWSCHQGQCGSKANRQHGVIDNSTNAPSNERLWCETETVDTRYISSDKPFQLRAASCCWIRTRNAGSSSWRLLTTVDLGTRSDTQEPNRSPDIAILPVLRVPQNCPRTYKLTTFDPDGDKVRCRYGNVRNVECGSCDQPSGFHLNPDSCTLQYNSASYDYRSYAFEMVVEDFPRGHITLQYSDGSQSSKSAALMRKKRQLYYAAAATTTTPWWWWQTTTTAAPTTTPWWWWHTTTTAAPTTTPWWWWQTTTTAAPTTTPWWWWQTTTTAAPTTTTAAPTTTTAAPTTTTAAPTTTTVAPTTTTAAPTTTTAAPTTTTAAPTTTTAAPTTTTAAPTTTTAAPTTTTAAPTTTTAAPTTTTAAPTTTTAAPTTTPWWWWQTTTTAAPTTTPWWWWQTTTTAAPTTTTAAPTTTTAAPTTTTAAPTTTTAAPTTTTAAPTTTTTAAPTTTTAAPTTTTAAPTTTTAAPTTTTTAAPTTTTAAPTTTTAAPTTTTAAPTTTTAAPTTTTAAPTTTTAAPTTTTAAPTTTTAAPTTTTAAPTTTTAAPTTTTAAPTTTTAAPTTTTAAPTTTTAAPTTTTAAPTTTTVAPTTTTAAPTTTTAAPTTTTAAPTTTTPTSPLSKLPLQFSLLVDKPVPSCQPGQYLPEYVSPTPQNGAHIHAEVDMEVEIRVKAQSSLSVIQDIIFSGPLNTRKHRTTHNEFVITWTPTSDHLGNHYVICFAVESVSGSNVYQSDMRCVVVDVGKKQVEANVICSQSTMRVEIEKSSFPRLSEDDLRLNDPSNVLCSLKTHSNSTHVIGIIPLNSCGTQIEEDEEFLKFKNEITTFDNSNNLITRTHLLEVKFYCQYPKRGNVTQSFTAHRNATTVWEKGFGKFTYQFEFYPNVQFQTMIDPHYYPLEYDLGSRIYMQIEATSSLNNTELFVESCSAAPYDNPNYMPVYPIIQNGCVMDSTVVIHSPAHQRQFKFSMEAFKFIGLHDQVYISCSVLMCQAGEPNTRCSQGCMTMNQGLDRRKRETVSQTSSHLVSQGPLRMRRSAERAESPVMNLNLNLVFIAGCLVAAVGMISGVAVYKAKTSRVKYQPLPTFED
ncbi:mucin-4-like isoform X2 [Labrus mixtus]|uniref:mucin-4-like isoform X2 n=1 Tax=Labrus mixtus TaxID=508554 RepID=UPI0029C02330|nr:mucin-4-like isoform X2 [Labrus mixtus]